MKTYLIDVEEITSFQVPIEAETEEQARELMDAFLDNACDYIHLGLNFGTSIREINEHVTATPSNGYSEEAKANTIEAKEIIKANQ